MYTTLFVRQQVRGKMVCEEVVRTAKIPCDRPLIRILALLFNRGHHLTTDLGRGWFRRGQTHSLEVRQGLWGYLEEGHEDRREHPAVTCNINRKGDESELAPHALPCASLSDHPTASEGVPDTIATVAVACAFRVFAGRGLPPQRTSGPSAGDKDVVEPYFCQYSPVCLTRWGGPQHASAPRVAY